MFHSGVNVSSVYFLDYGLRAQGIKPEGIYHSQLQPYAAIWGLFWWVRSPRTHHQQFTKPVLYYHYLRFSPGTYSLFSLAVYPSSGRLMHQISSRGVWKPLALFHFIIFWLIDNFVSDINLPLFALLYVGYKIVMRTKIVSGRLI